MEKGVASTTRSRDYDPEHRHLAYNFFTKLPLQRHAAGIAEAAMIADEKTRIREDTFLVYLPSELNLAAGRFVLRTVEAADSKADDVLQIADLLTGCANAFASGTAGRKGEVCAEAIRLGVFDPATIWDWRP